MIVNLMQLMCKIVYRLLFAQSSKQLLKINYPLGFLYTKSMSIEYSVRETCEPVAEIDVLTRSDLLLMRFVAMTHYDVVKT